MCCTVNDESRIRYRARRRGFSVMQTRGAECRRREQAGIGTYLLLDQSTNSTALHAATLHDIADFLKTHHHAAAARAN